MKIVLTGGGTAGHIMPNVALLDELKKHYNEIHYIGSENGMEKSIMSAYPFVKYHPITTVKLIRSLTLKNLLIPFKLIKGNSQAKKLLKEIKPNVVFSKGGYISVPVCNAAKKLGVPIVSHESDYSMGLANKMIYKKCNQMCCSFEDTCNKRKKCSHTGSAIRKQLLSGSKSKAKEEYGLNPSLPTICITGGSLGAKRINETFYGCMENVLDKFNVIHLCGKGKKQGFPNLKTKGKYVALEFIPNPEHIFAACDIALCRAGSNTIFEFLALEKPMLLLPLSKKASRGDQILNSEYFKQKGFAEYILDEDLSPKILEQKINDLYKSRAKYIEKMHNSGFKIGNDKILDVILKNSK